jgi:hypothetical protein
MFGTIFGVDFSGAKLAGRNTWIARLEAPPTGPARLLALAPLEDVAGTAERGPALARLVELIGASDDALWACDFPFGLPVELFADGWPRQLAFTRAWPGDAHALGLEMVKRSQALAGKMHCRRLTDAETSAPFDAYHYRIQYQTFHGMRDVLGPLERRPRTAVLPFQYRKLPTARRVLVEACPASTLRRLGLPHQNYKQTEGGPLTEKRRRVRRTILAGLRGLVRFGERQRRLMMDNPGGDALDAVLAAVGARWAFAAADHAAIARHPRYPREGRLFV